MAAPRCGGGCDGREDGAVEALLQWQKVSDFLIGASYLSIPLELLHFATCADLAPLRWVLLQFGAFTVLCGIVHFAAVLTYARPDSRRLLLAFTAAKALAALAASVAAVSLPAFIPHLLRLKTREALLRDKARQLDRDVAAVQRRQETAARVVRAITQHVRRGGGALPHDAHAVLRTAVLHLSDDVMAAVLTQTTPHGETASAAAVAAGVSLARRPFDLRALVRDAAAVSGCLARCRGIGFSHRAETSSLPGGCWVVGDDRRVIILTLCSRSNSSSDSIVLGSAWTIISSRARRCNVATACVLFASWRVQPLAARHGLACGMAHVSRVVARMACMPEGVRLAPPLLLSRFLLQFVVCV